MATIIKQNRELFAFRAINQSQNGIAWQFEKQTGRVLSDHGVFEKGKVSFGIARNQDFFARFRNEIG